jgi:hypothetical protein
MKKIYCGLFLLFLMAIFNNPLNAQISNYAFSQQTGQTYTEITGGTAISPGVSDDDSSYSNLPIGFTFNFNGSDYTAFGISTNGYIGLGSGDLGIVLNNPLNIGTGRVISAFAFDLVKKTTSDFMYKTEGTTPNRVLTVQYKNFTTWATGYPILNFQIKLFEASNQIKICYGAMSNIDGPYSPQVGISGNSNADFVCRTTSDNWTATTNSTSAAYCAFNSSSYPPAGLIYTYATTPSLTTQAVSNIGTTIATGNGTITSLGRTNPTQYGVVWSTATNPTVALSTKTTQGAIATTGAFTSDITGLTANTLYYVRAYATNDAGTGYGPEVSFTTLNLPLTITAPTLASKVYDGTTDASSVTTPGTVSGKVSGDDVTVNIATSVYDNQNTGTGKTVTVTYSLSGADMAKYSAPAASVVATGEITAKPVTVTADAGKTKVYGQVDPVLTFTVAPALFGSDNFTGALTRASGENVGSTFAINLGTLSAGTNYNITFVSQNFSISPLNISGTFTAGNKTYDGINTASITGRSLVGVLAADVANVSLTGGTATFNDKQVGTGKVVTSSGMSLSGTMAANYNLTGVATSTANITPATVTVTTVSGQTKVYGSVDPVFTYSVSPALFSGDNFTGALSRAAGENAGGYAINVGTLNAGANYNVIFASNNFNITAKPITVSATTGQTKVYGNVDPVFIYSVSPALVGSDNFTGALTRTSGENVGSTYAISLGTLSAGTNYNITFVSKNFSISKLDISGIFTAGDKTYNSNNTASITGRSLVGVLAADVANVSLTGGTATFSDKQVGTGKVVTSSGMGLSGTAATNYNLTGVATTTANISKATVTVTAVAGQTKVYGSVDPVFTYSVSPALFSGDNFAGVLSRSTGENAGAYAINVGTLNAGANYIVTFVSNNFSITTKPITVTATTGQTKVFGTVDPVFNYSFSPVLVGSDNFTGVLTRVTGQNAGLYAIGLGTLSAGTNYNISFVSNNFSITPKPITITATAGQTKAYGGADPVVLTYTFAPVLLGSDTFTGALTRAAGETAGDYSIQIGTLSAGANYILNLANQVFNISKLNVSGTFTAGNKVYDASNTATITSRSLVGVLTADLANISLSGGTATFNDKLVGTGKVVTSLGMSLTGAAALNYNLTSVATTTANITKLDISGTFTVSSKTYDGNNTVVITGRSLVGVPASDVANVSLVGGTATFSNAQAGIAKVVTSSGMSLSGTAVANYNLTGVATTIANINRSIIIVTADGKTKVYGEADPLFTYAFEPALVGTDTFTGALSRRNGEDIGTYAINAGTLNAGTNYTIAFVSADLGITIKSISVTANPGQTKVYGDVDPVLSYTVVPALVGSDILGGALSRTVGENIGSAYAIGIGTLANPNYSITFTGDYFGITAKPITVTATAGQTKVYGDVDPTLTYTVSPALVGSDAMAGAISRIAGENAGSYALNAGTLDAGSNYTISFVSNNFTITAKPITVTADAGKTKVYGSADPVFTYTVSETLASGNNFAGALSRATGENVGLYAINPGTLSVGTNYNISFVSKNFTITQKAISVNSPTLTASKTYDGTTIANVTAGTLLGKVTGDESKVSVSAVATYTNKNVGTGKTINVVYSLTGSASSNYIKPVDYSVSTGQIAAKQLTISNSAITTNKMYDGNTTAVIESVGTITGVLVDEVSNVNVSAIANYNEATVGLSKTITVVYTLSGSAAANYIAPANLLISSAKISEKIVLNNTLITTTAGCEGSNMELSYTVSNGTPVQYQIVFGSAALSAGFQNISFTILASSGSTGVVDIPVPSQVSYGNYQATLQMVNELGVESDVYPFQFVINLSTDYIIPKFDDVVLCDNHTNSFSSYQWYKNGTAISGATGQYYNDPNGLVGSYSLKLKTVTGQDLQTCSKVLNIPKAKKVSVSVYPNPMRANQESTVKISGMSDEEMQGAVMSVYNVQGIQVYATRNVLQTNSLILSGLDGAYVGHIITTKGNDYVYRILLVK